MFKVKWYSQQNQGREEKTAQKTFLICVLPSFVVRFWEQQGCFQNYAGLKLQKLIHFFFFLKKNQHAMKGQWWLSTSFILVPNFRFLMQKTKQNKNSSAFETELRNLAILISPQSFHSRPAFRIFHLRAETLLMSLITHRFWPES